MRTAYGNATMLSLESWWLKMVKFDLRDLLIPRNLTLREFSEISGINYWTVVHMSQRTYKSIKITDVEKICEALDIMPNQLFGYESKREIASE
ncbi:helix-turn-helix domain-containing protein [Companilactobacillus halodurans]|uniref:Helix-turn-helix transcriptional regulator n=1 Tax=Companilactobacillus halodurans TaxID=2584183 RepID=A0A5P0ZTN5_9LACO|nr:helix-turn-helix transcriptional regulator [Companilactobacillus halodurans]MQS96367.1 helix-turn-helix transcriptional regulator [Companilactobacillus halodurans]